MRMLLCLMVGLTLGSMGWTEMYYVRMDSPAPVYPFTNWTIAARTIQEAVDAASDGDTVWVSNGVYNTGGSAIPRLLTNRVSIYKPVAVRSVNGPGQTFIVGRPGFGGSNGLGAVRCVYLTNGAMLAGFTLTNGYTLGEGFDAMGGGGYCESTTAVVDRCVLSGNSAAGYGGGSFNGTISNCLYVGNNAELGGGGATYGRLRNCWIVGNRAAYWGGGVVAGTLIHCTVVDNWAEKYYGGGVYSVEVYDSIVYYNRAAQGDDDAHFSALYNCCAPANVGMAGGLTNEPGLASWHSLATNSPCVGMASASDDLGSDMHGELWCNPPALGADEPYGDLAIGAMNVQISASYTQIAVGFAVEWRSRIDGRVAGSEWDFGDGKLKQNAPLTTHAWAEPGLFDVVLRAWNADALSGVSATVRVEVVDAPGYYVNAVNAMPEFPFTNMAMAAATLQEAVDAVQVVGSTVWVLDGRYDRGGKTANGEALSNRVMVSMPMTVRSVNGPGNTAIVGKAGPSGRDGPGAVRGVYLVDGAELIGFTITNGHTLAAGNTLGGGVYCESTGARITDCLLAGNSAREAGGGAYQGTLRDCLLRGNIATNGGGANLSILYNCMVEGNSAYSGAGVMSGSIYDSTVTRNASYYGAGIYDSMVHDSLISSNNGRFGGGAYNGGFYTCRFEGNTAWYGAGTHYGYIFDSFYERNQASFGGGEYQGKLYNCLLTGNIATNGGGGYFGQMFNCTVAGNSAGQQGGGVYGSTLINSIVYFNSASSNVNHTAVSATNTCTTPQPAGEGNLDSDPCFMDFAGGNFRLQSNSPCINAGLNQYWMGGSSDLDGAPRIRNQVVDMGAYEVESWSMYVDTDGDGYSDLVEVEKPGTDPLDPESYPRILSLTKAPSGEGVVIRWLSSAGRQYRIERSTHAVAEEWVSVTGGLTAEPPFNGYTNTTAPGDGIAFYRIVLE
ncbi:MAG: choice-of-anchor Q domain-containing protein [Lentisphaerota bacterium]